VHEWHAVARSNGTDVVEGEHGTVELVESIIDDSRALVGAHLEALRDDVREQVAALGVAVRSSLLAVSLIIVATLLVGIAMAESIIALGLPAWAAFWIVALAVAALGVWLVRRARGTARTAGQAAAHTAERVEDDVALISKTLQHEQESS
jgi:hypothetical protein